MENGIVLIQIDGMLLIFIETGKADVVLGPSTDGGYYLISMRTLHPEIFTGIPWSTGDVLSATLKKAQETGLRTKLLAEWDDIDTYQDLLAFQQMPISRNQEWDWMDKMGSYSPENHPFV